MDSGLETGLTLDNPAFHSNDSVLCMYVRMQARFPLLVLQTIVEPRFYVPPP
jgi:hypothetical protein